MPLIGVQWLHAPGKHAFSTEHRGTGHQSPPDRPSPRYRHLRALPQELPPGLERFFTWVPGARPHFSKTLVQEYRVSLLASGLSAATVNLRLAPVRRLAREMADNGLLDPAVAAAVGRVTGSPAMATG